MLGSQYFYFTGHQSTIPAIRFEAAFVGLPGDLDNLVLPGEWGDQQKRFIHIKVVLSLAYIRLYRKDRPRDRIFSQAICTTKPGFHTIVFNVRIVSIAEFFVTQSGRKDRKWLYRNDRFTSDVGIVKNNRKRVSV